MPRLRTATFFIDESSGSRARRGHESTNRLSYMCGVTAGKANFRNTRSMRTIQGMDFVYQLRGMRSVNWYDFGRWLDGRRIEPIRDWSFGNTSAVCGY